jgi:hypothetical protein
MPDRCANGAAGGHQDGLGFGNRGARLQAGAGESVGDDCVGHGEHPFALLARE